MKKQTKKILFSLTADLFESMKEGAKHAGLTRSGFMREAVQEKLKRIEREKFIEALQRKH